MKLNPNEYTLSEQDHQSIFEKGIIPDLFARVVASENPVAVIFGGQPGAGKSASVDNAIKELKSFGGAVLIEGDALRDFHPMYQKLMDKDDKTAAFYTDRDSGKWVEKSIAYAKEKRFNLVIEGTMRNPDVVEATMKNLREAGYEIDARALAVPWQLSEQGIIQRYENQKLDRGVGRMTTPEAHKAAYDGMLNTLDRIERDKLADRIIISRRGDETIYSNVLENGFWKQTPQARLAVETERSRPQKPQEAYQFAAGYATLVQQVEASERKATEQEKADMRRRYEQATQQAIEVSSSVAKLLAARAKASEELVNEKLSLQEKEMVLRQFDKRACTDLQVQVSVEAKVQRD